MVVVAIQPLCRFMDRCGMGTSTRKIAHKLWGETIPAGDPASLVRQLYAVENENQPEPSGSQDMAGLIYPGINRLDYDAKYEGGYFPAHIESCIDPVVAEWLGNVIYMLPVNQRPPGYAPLGIKNLDPSWIQLLGQSGKDCYDAILTRDVHRLGASMNLCMRCWEAILPNTVRHPTLDVPLMSLLAYYQQRYPGAMFSGCGGGYLYVVSERPVPGGFQVKVHLANQRPLGGPDRP